MGNRKTASDLLFEEYLAAHGHGDWAHEPPVKDGAQKPDYRMFSAEASLYFEVKEFDSQPPPRGFGAFDPYAPIRKKITRAAPQFKQFREFPCSLILANPKNAFVQIGDPWVITGAMFGNVGFLPGVGHPPGMNDPVQRAFTSGGKIVYDRAQPPQNTILSSVITLLLYPLRMNRIRVALKQWEAQLGRKTTTEETLAVYGSIPDTSDLRTLSVIVYENPYARFPLRRDLFCGPFDQRFGANDGHIERIYVGSEAAKAEAALEAVGAH